MKKAKIMLIAIAIVGVAGGVLAHNARKSSVLLYTEPDNGGNCNVATTLDYKTTVAGSGTPIELGTKFDDSHSCPVLFFTNND